MLEESKSVGVKQPPNEGQLLSAAKLRTGYLYSTADTNHAIESLQTLLRQDGFYNADVQAEVEYEPEWEEAHVSFKIDPATVRSSKRRQLPGMRRIRLPL